MAFGQLIFVAGGVRSGKSAYAESLIHASPGDRKLYIASGVGNDAEMKERIERHQKDRAHAGWRTVEQPRRMPEVLQHIRGNDAVLWDCATAWLANELYAGNRKGTLCADEAGCMEKKWAELQKTVEAMQEEIACLVIVSNEVLDEPLCAPGYQAWLGKIHQWFAHRADQAIEMENGIAIRRK